MQLFERFALGLLGVLGVLLVGATLSHPPAGATSAPKAMLPLSASALVPRKKTLLDDPELFNRMVSRPTVNKLRNAFSSMGYDLDSVLSGNSRVPRIFLASLPPDMAQIQRVDLRKALFFKTVLPLILQINEEILAERRRLWRLRHRIAMGLGLDAVDRLWLTVMAERHGVERGDVDGLLRRMDVIPSSLALAQSAEESGWGTSRFVREGNALFGQRVFVDAGHLVPRRRDKGERHMIKAFDNVIDSVRSYVLNLNTHRAYREFRRERETMRRQGKPIDGWVLAENLTRYSQRGRAYVRTIRTIIGTNNLRPLDDARLHEREPVSDPQI